ncbi:MAG: hypothetical protein KA028_00430 [Candidatus Pacebacteria bacterium]|nr:hypothetical protein [Candidatus Paceibacterota bacterium]MBP9851970.1 hypothetical protein [Candidatus Paceibacterota bacterium]
MNPELSLQNKTYFKKANWLLGSALIGIFLTLLYATLFSASFATGDFENAKFVRALPGTVYFLIVSFSLLWASLYFKRGKNGVPFFIFSIVLIVSSLFLTRDALMTTGLMTVTMNLMQSVFVTIVGSSIAVFPLAILFWIGIIINILSLKSHAGYFKVSKKKFLYYIFISLMCTFLFWGILALIRSSI